MSRRSIADWLDDRTGFRAIVHHALDEPVPGGARWAYVFGSVLVGCIAIQAVTGWALMTVYAPSATSAWASVQYLTYGVSWGWLVRGLHHFGAQAMVIVLALHLAQVAIYGAYKAPREMNWLFGLGLFGITLGFALTGYLLPWDQKGYWATRVATNIAGTVPLAGGAIQRLLQGGAEYGSLTLTRFYTLHVAILPALLVGLLVLHVALFRKHGVTPGARANLSKIDPFYPHQLAKDVAAVVLVLAGIFVLAWREHGAPLDAPADPASDYPARPEWYFLSLFQMLKYFAGSLEVVGALLIPAVVGLFLVLLPWLDRGESRAIGPRIKWLAPLGALGAGIVILTFLSMRSDARDEPFQKARRMASKRAEAADRLARKGVPPEGPLVMLRRDPDTRGPVLFQEHCASCHRLGKEFGPEPEKATAPDLTGFGTAEWVLSMLDNPDAPNRFAKTPFQGEMVSLIHPPAGATAKEIKAFKPMPEADRRKVATFLAAEAAEVKDPGHDAEGAKVISRACTSCHLFRGQTDDDDSSGPELAGWASSAWVRAQIANPGTAVTYRPASMSDKRKGHMPRFDDKLEPQDITLLADWVRKEAVASAKNETISVAKP